MSATKGNPGKQLERLIAMLESALANGSAKIESPSRRLKDRDTGQPREHDVLIIWDHGHHEIFTAIECRDRSRPVGVPAVEAFADKCGATGVHSGVIVSASGFCATARTKAAARAITCMEISEVSRFDWLAPEAEFVGFVGYERQFDGVHAQIMFASEMPDQIDAIFDTDGNEVSLDQITQIVMNSVPRAANQDDIVDKSIPINLRMETVGWRVRDAKGEFWCVDHILATTSYSTKRTEHGFSSHLVLVEAKIT
jgi:Restriction endonuclease